jgi:hypothetical protein
MFSVARDKMSFAERAKQPTIRVTPEDKAKLDRICQEDSISHTTALRRAIFLLERERLNDRIQAEFEQLASNPAALAAMRKESAVFEGASADGL